jgi:hypothetical protein
LTVRAIACLAMFNVFLAALGTALLLALRPASSWKDLLRLVGLSYLLGVATLMVLLTLLIVVGIPVTLAVIVLVAVVVALCAAWFGIRRRPSPVGRTRPASLLSIGSAVMFAAIVVALEAVFRKGRLQGLLEFDSWDSWGPKTKALYHFGHLDSKFLDGLPGGSYPPGLPALLSAALHAIGSADMVTLHLQYWFLGVGFLAALVGLMASRVTPFLLLPFVLLVYVMPDIRNRSVDMYGDLPLGFLIVTAAVLLALWLDNPRRWHLPASAALFAAAVLTKREGVILAGCVLVAALVASADRIRADWPRLIAVFVATIAAWLPWQLWIRAMDLPGTGPEGGLHFLTDLDRGGDSFDVVTRNLFDYDLWLMSLTIAIAAVGLCVLVRAWRAATYLSALIAALLLGCTVILWSDSNLQLSDVNVVSRLVGTVALVVVAVSPLALQRAWEAADTGQRRPAGAVPVWRVAFSWVIVVLGSIAYPATLLIDGGARFPKASDCVVAPSTGDQVLVVFGHERSYPAAFELRRRATESGIDGVEVGPDGCGRVRVARTVESRAAADDLIRTARVHGLQADLEAGKPT